jgi:hypothetical protein
MTKIAYLRREETPPRTPPIAGERGAETLGEDRTEGADGRNDGVDGRNDGDGEDGRNEGVDGRNDGVEGRNEGGGDE